MAVQFGTYLGLARRWWLTFLLATVIGAVAGWLAAGAMPASYRSEARILVGPVNANFDTLRASSELTTTYADLATSDKVLTDAIRGAALTQTPDELAAAVKTTPNADARTIAIDVELPSADESARAANGIADAMTAYTAAGTDRPEGQLSVVGRAVPPTSAVSPRTALIVLLAGVGALLGALLIVSAIEYLDPTVRDADHLGRVAGPSLLAIVPVAGRRGLLRRGRSGARPQDPAFRTLLGDVVARARTPVRALLVTSTSDGADAAEVSAGLAMAAAQVGARVAAVDAADDGRLEAVLSGAGSGDPVDPEALPSTSRGAVAIAEEPAPGSASGMPANGEPQVLDDVHARNGQGEPELPVIAPELTERVRFVRNHAVRAPGDAAAIRDGLLRDDELVIVDAGSIQGAFSPPIWAQVVDSVLIVTTLGRGRRDVLEDAVDRLTTANADVWVVGAKRVSAGRLGRRRGPADAGTAQEVRATDTAATTDAAATEARPTEAQAAAEAQAGAEAQADDFAVGSTESGDGSGNGAASASGDGSGHGAASADGAVSTEPAGSPGDEVRVEPDTAAPVGASVAPETVPLAGPDAVPEREDGAHAHAGRGSRKADRSSDRA